MGSIVLAVLGPKILDHYVTRPLVEKGIFSSRVAPFFTASALLGTMRLFGSSAAWTALKKAPQFTAIKKIVDSAYDAIGLPRTEMISMGLDALSVSPFAVAYAYPKSFVARILSTSAGGVLSGVGGVLLIDQLSVPVLSGGAHLYFDLSSDLPGRDATLWDLSVATAQETVSREMPLGEYLPNIASAAYGLVSFWDHYIWEIKGTKYNDIEEKIEARFDSKMETLRAHANRVGQVLNGHLLSLQAAHLSLEGGQLRMDWDGFRGSVLVFYRANQEQIQQAYQLPYDILPGDAATIAQSINSDGIITDLDALKMHLLSVYASTFNRKLKELEQRAFEFRLEVTNDQDWLKPAEPFQTLTCPSDVSYSTESPHSAEEYEANQADFLEGEGKTLVEDIQFLKKLMELLRR